MAYDSSSLHPELIYPSVPASPALTTDSLNTYNMGRARKSAEEPNSLEDSAYEVLSNVSETSDGEGHTASVASTPDNVSVFGDEDDDDEDEDFPIHHGDQNVELPGRHHEAYHRNVDMAMDESSTLTESPYLAQSENARIVHLLEYIDPVGDGRIGVSVTKNFMPEQESEEPLKSYGWSDIQLVLEARLSDRHLPACESFRILHVGLMETWRRLEVDSLIGSALDASPGPSRSIMRRGQMEPLGPIVTSDHCTRIAVLDKHANANTVKVTMHDGMDIIFGSRQAYSPVEAGRIPDLAILWYPQSILNPPEIEQYQALYEAFKSEQIPCLHVAEQWRFHAQFEKYFQDDKSLCLFVEGRDLSEGECVREKIPIDFYTLTNLDRQQLNRHLATLKPEWATSSQSSTTKEQSNHNVRSPLAWMFGKSNKSNFLMNARAPGHMVMLLAPLVAVAVAYLLSASPLFAHVSDVPIVDSARFDSKLAPAGNTATAQITATTSQVSIPSPSAAAKVTSQDLTVVSAQQVPPSKQRGKTNSYKIHITGDHQFMLISSAAFFDVKGKSPLRVLVSRDSDDVPIHLHCWTKNTYIVDLAQEYDFGPFNVSITAQTRPLTRQSFSVNLGRNKTMFGSFFDGARRDLATTGQELTKLSSAILEPFCGANLHSSIESKVWKKLVRVPHGLASRLHRVQNETENRLATGSHILHEALRDAWNGVRLTTAPLRTSAAALRARDNAFLIRCGLEQAVGLSGKDDNGKKSRSCKQVGR